MEVSFPEQIATITMKEGSELTEETLKKAFAETQFTVKTFDQDGVKKDEDKDAEHENDGDEGKEHKDSEKKDEKKKEGSK